MEKILIIRLSSIGDIILTTPLIRAVRQKYPEAQIDFVVKSQFQSLLLHNRHISNLITFDKKSDNIKTVKEGIMHTKYDWIVDIHRNFRSYYLTRGAKAQLVTRYKKYIFKRQLLVWLGMNIYGDEKQVVERYFEAVKVNNVAYDGMGTEVIVPTNEKAKVDNLLLADGYEPDCNIVCICPGASFANKRWLPERFAEVADHLATHKNYQIALLGGPEDKELCDKVLSDMKTPAHSYAGKFSLLESAAILARSVLAVTNDTGLMHLAQSQKTAVAAIFGPTTKELGYFPLKEKSEVLQTSINCRPCTHNGLDKCPKGHFKCMKEITTQMVTEACETLTTG